MNESMLIRFSSVHFNLVLMDVRFAIFSDVPDAIHSIFFNISSLTKRLLSTFFFKKKNRLITWSGPFVNLSMCHNKHRFGSMIQSHCLSEWSIECTKQSVNSFLINNWKCSEQSLDINQIVVWPIQRNHLTEMAAKERQYLRHKFR